MPTTTRLVAALLMAALGWVVSQLAIPYLPEGKAVGQFGPVSALIGLLVGWLWTGSKVEARTGRPMGLGFIGSVLLLFWVLFAFSGYEMLQRSTNLRYGGPVEAVQDMVAIAIAYLRDVGQIDVMGVLAAGGIVIGAISGWVARRYR
jgi:hypothetical protein